MDAQANDPSVIFAKLKIAKRTFMIAVDAAATDPVSLAYRGGNFAPIASLVELAQCLLRPGDRVLDLGAHLGGFALTAAALGCQVLAVEASPRNAELLRLSVRRNQFQHLQVVQAAVSAEPGTLSFSCHGPWGHVASAVTGLPAIIVPAVRVDDLVEKNQWQDVQFIKMDIEGSEIRALHGMQKLLSRPDAPVLFYESNKHTLAFYGETSGHLQAELRRMHNRIYRVHNRSLVLEPEGAEQKEEVVDFLAVRQLPVEIAHWLYSPPGAFWRKLGRLLGGKRS